MTAKLFLGCELLLAVVARCSETADSVSAVADAEQTKDPYWFLTETGMDPEIYQAAWEDLPIGYLDLTVEDMGQIDPPHYMFRFSADGTAAFRGLAHVGKMGDHTGKIRLWDFGRLCALAKSMELEAKSGKYMENVSHGTETTLKVWMKDGTSYQIRDYANQAPIEFWGFCAAMEQVADGLYWKPRF
jgi:hypothetical protein